MYSTFAETSMDVAMVIGRLVPMEGLAMIGCCCQDTQWNVTTWASRFRSSYGGIDKNATEHCLHWNSWCAAVQHYRMSPSKLHWFTISALVVFTVILLFNAIPFLERTSPLALSIPSKADTFHAPRQNIWVELSEHEADDVIKFLSSRADLNLTRRAAAAG